MKFLVLDSEGDNLAYSCTKLWNLGWTEDGENYGFTTDYDEMREVLTQEDTLFVCHNSIRHDMVVFNHLLGLNMPYNKFVDSLALSWYLFPDRNEHGLESWGASFGFPKVKVAKEEWAEGNVELMRERVLRDVKINHLLWKKQWERLQEIYVEDTQNILRFIRYLSWKMDCLREQEANPLKIDREKAKKHYDELSIIVETKREELRQAMPKVPQMAYYNKPKVCYKKDGSISSHGAKWFSTLSRLGLPEGSVGPVGEVVSYEEGNPNSDPQLKEWLFSLGWQPCTHKFVRNKETGEEKQIPQVRYFSQNDPRKGELTDSVKALIEKEPSLQALDGLTVAKHRQAIFKAFLDMSDEEGYCAATAGGLTNTLRLQHRNPFVNLPKADGEVPWGKEIRGCIVAPEGYEMCGSDVVSLESTTKRHFMFPHDPEYVKEMSKDGFDEHCDLAIHAGALSREEYELKGPKHPDIKPIRKNYKATNYSAVYSIGPPKLARELFITVSAAKKLLNAYWDRNWAVKKVVSEQYIKTLKDRTMWLKNPVSGFYYSLRYEKDIFSTLNQGTGVFIFDSWLMRVRRKGIVVQGQMHDEIFFRVKPTEKDSVVQKLNTAMEEVNQSLSLNVQVKVDIQFGENYAAVH